MGSTRAAAIACVVGFAVMCLELTAVRLMAPHFGDSAFVWTNVIGVILVALAIGAWMGGRASTPDRIRFVLLAGGAYVALVPWFADGLGDWLVPNDLALDAAMGALVLGSLVGTLALFAVPVLLAGMVTPMLVAARVTAGSAVGAASGSVAAWSTIGSLFGTFAATHVLVPGIGSQWTIALCAAGLIVGGLLARPGGAAAAVLLVPIATPIMLHGARSTPPDGTTMVAEVESAYQYLTVVRDDRAEPGTTQLQINEGLDSFHSVSIDGTPFTGGRYYDWFAATPFLVTDGDEPRELRILSLGAAAGTFDRLLAHVCIDPELESVEIDPAVVTLAEEHFGGFPEASQVTTGIDARVYVNRTRSTFDLVLIDAYERQIYIPAHVASREFFEAVRRRLDPGGIVAINAGGRTFDDPVVNVIGRTMASVFGGAAAFRVPRSRNFMIVGRREAAFDPEVLSGIITDDERLNEILARTSDPSQWREFEAAEPILWDDRPFLDREQEISLTRNLGADGLLPMTGKVPAGDAERAAHAARANEDLDRLAEILRTADRPTGFLRFQAGDLRWLQHDLRGARDEYRAALELGVDGPQRSAIESRLASAEEEIRRLDYAAGVASRNGWTAFVLVGLLLGAAFGLRPRSK